MTPEHHQRVRQLFEQALDRPVTERVPFLVSVCAGDTALFEDVNRLLTARDSSSSFLEKDAGRPERIGRYVIRGELGRGAMGVVYDAIDPMIGRSVAVKVIHLKALTESHEAEFLRDRLFLEARSAGQLFHPAIVVILDVGQEGDTAFVAMERVNGQSLQQILESGGMLPADRALSILRQTAAALDYAHQHGIVHRDIKPANIMLHDGDTVKVADFGIAKIMSRQQTTLTGMVMGTPIYMAPEQLQSRPVDGKSDQFSLGVMAYELLTGTRPFRGDSLAALAHSIVYEERPSAQAINPLLPLETDHVLKKALAREPEERFTSCAEFVETLAASLHTEPEVEAAPIPEQVQPAKSGRKPLGRVAGIVLGFGAATVALVLYWHSLSRPSANPASPNPESSNPVSPNAAPAADAPSAVNSAPVAGSAAPAIRQFLVDPPSIEPGGSAVLKWEVTGVRQVTIDQGVGRVDASGTFQLAPRASTTYLLTADGAGRSARAQVFLTVKPKPVSPAERARQLFADAVEKRNAHLPHDAAVLFRQAADLGDAASMVELGEIYHTGEGLPQDQSEAVRWFRRAADTGDSSGMVYLGSMYLFGDGVPVSEAAAANWFLKATAAGNPAGMFDLASMYENGQGVPKDLNKAMQLYQRSADAGNIEARRRLIQLRPHK